MKPKQFVDALDDAAVVAAITEAERKTSGEIRIFIASAAVTNPVAAAEAQFKRLKMHQTAGRNAVLIFIAPLSRNFAVIGDVAVHERCGQVFWDTMATVLSERFKTAAFTDGVIDAIRTTGDLLAAHFPSLDNDRDELPNTIERG